MSYELRGLRSTQSHGPWQLSLQFYRSPRYQPHNSSSQDQANHWQDLMSSRTQRAFASTQGCSGGCCHAASPARYSLGGCCSVCSTVKAEMEARSSTACSWGEAQVADTSSVPSVQKNRLSNTARPSGSVWLRKTAWKEWRPLPSTRSVSMDWGQDKARHGGHVASPRPGPFPPSPGMYARPRHCSLLPPMLWTPGNQGHPPNSRLIISLCEREPCCPSHPYLLVLADPVQPTSHMVQAQPHRLLHGHNCELPPV